MHIRLLTWRGDWTNQLSLFLKHTVRILAGESVWERSRNIHNQICRLSSSCSEGWVWGVCVCVSCLESAHEAVPSAAAAAAAAVSACTYWFFHLKSWGQRERRREQQLWGKTEKERWHTHTHTHTQPEDALVYNHGGCALQRSLRLLIISFAFFISFLLFLPCMFKKAG